MRTASDFLGLGYVTRVSSTNTDEHTLPSCQDSMAALQKPHMLRLQDIPETTLWTHMWPRSAPQVPSPTLA